MTVLELENITARPRSQKDKKKVLNKGLNFPFFQSMLCNFISQYTSVSFT